MKIAIAGYAAEGKSNYEYFSRRGDITIVDEREDIFDLPPNVPTILGKDAFSKLQNFDMVVRTASLAPRKVVTNGKIWSTANEFFEKCPATIIGVTGSKGKGTTCSLIAEILRKAGKTVHLVGNIGVPALDILSVIKPEDMVVYELSSFQLWDLKKSPQVAVVLMIEPDHLDIHADMEDYVAAKSNIVRFQHKDDIVIFNASNNYSRQIGESSKALKQPFPVKESAHVADGFFWYGGQKLCSDDVLRIPGVHNQINACAAIDVVWQWVNDPQIIESGLTAFTGLPHRLKFVRRVDGVDYYDDSIATTPGSAIAAVKAFPQPKIMILGGSSKGASFTEMAKTMTENNVKMALVIGDESTVIEKVLQAENIATLNLGSSVTMDDIVQKAAAMSVPGDIVILSPACASFGMFKSYNDRGDQFITAVEKL